MNIASALVKQAAERGEAPAILSGAPGQEKTMTFRELEEASARVAGYFGRLGLEVGDRVLLVQNISMELYVVLLGLFRRGLVGVMVDPGGGLKHFRRCCEVASPRLSVGSWRAHLLRFFIPALGKIPGLSTRGSVPWAWSWRQAMRTPPDGRIEDVRDEAPALLTFTRESAGMPRAAMRTHGFLLAQHRVLERHLRLQPGEIDLATLPLFVLANLASGVTTLLPQGDLRRPGAIHPFPILRQIRECRPTRSMGLPAFFARLARAGGEGSASPIKKLFVGSAPIFPRTLRSMRAWAPASDPEAVYGSAAAESIAHMRLSQITREDEAAMAQGRGLLVGKPVPELTARILPDRWGQPRRAMSALEFADEEVKIGEVGEIVLSGEHVLPGYWRGAGDEETKFRVDGAVWHRTGDAGHFDHEGRLWLQGRCSSKVIDDRGTLYPFTVECAASFVDGIARTAFVAHENRRWLWLELEPEATRNPALILGELAAKLAWARIDGWPILDHLPVDRRNNSKMDYEMLRLKMKRADPGFERLATSQRSD